MNMSSLVGYRPLMVVSIGLSRSRSLDVTSATFLITMWARILPGSHVPVPPCSRAPMFPFSHKPMLLRSVPMLPCSHVLVMNMFSCFRVPMFPCSHVLVMNLFSSFRVLVFSCLTIYFDGMLACLLACFLCLTVCCCCCCCYCC